MSEPYSLCAAVAVSTLVAAAAVSVAADDLVSRLAPCLACHGENGKSELPEVPSLGAQNAPYTLIQLYLFREKQRASEIMNDAAKGLSDDDLRNVADFVGKLPAPQPVEGGDAVRLDRGRALLGIGLTYALDDAMPRLVVSDAARLWQVLVNLLANCRPPQSLSVFPMI